MIPPPLKFRDEKRRYGVTGSNPREWEPTL